MSPYTKALAILSAANFSVLFLILAGAELTKKFANFAFFGLSFELVIWPLVGLVSCYILVRSLLSLKSLGFGDKKDKDAG